MKLALFSLTILGLIVQQSFAPPVTNNKEEEPKDDENRVQVENELSGIEYHRYLREVVEALETDPEFREKLKNAKEEDLKSGKIAHELERVNHHLRSKLDEIKRAELERLKHLVMRENEIENELRGHDQNTFVDKQHLDHENPLTFEVEDLKKLIAKTTHDLAEADKKRREEFKEYEMQKKFDEEEKMKGNEALKDEEERKKYHEELEKMKEKHQKHEPLHHPGSKQQLEEVWDKQDHMGDQEFDPKVFFRMHDVDGNGFWDQDEVKALFRKELDKMYNEGAPEDDLVERAEEMERMREHVFTEVDRNGDGVIDYNEFLSQAKNPDFDKDEGWKSIDQEKIYTQEEYEAFERQRHDEMQRHMAQQMPPHPDLGHQQQFPQQHIDPNQQHYQNQLPQYQGQPPIHHQQQYTGQVPPQHQQPQYQGQPPIHQQQYAQQVPPGHQQQYQQVPAHQQQYQQVPPAHQQQYQQPPVPVQHQQQQYQGQVPAQQVPVQQQQYQMPPQQVPRDQISPEHQYQGQVVQPVVNQPLNTHPQQVNSQVNPPAPAVPGQITQTHEENKIIQNQAAPQQNSVNEATKNSAAPQVAHV